MLYIGSDDAYFEPDNPEDHISPGTLWVRPAAKFKVGDGGHHTNAIGDVVAAHAHGDEVLERLAANGQPIIVVLDDSYVRRAQDFGDLQKNSKPLNASVAQSMDRRQKINQMLLEQVIKAADIPVFGQTAAGSSSSPTRRGSSRPRSWATRQCGTPLEPC